ncbi:MAG: VWA domain-containing protein [Aristaeellaceae bacterium]
MKKLLSLMIVLVLAMACSGGALAQDDAGRRTVSPALDIVLLIDRSNSMTGGDTNDPEGYRYDAAEMIVAMCGTDGSRVAVLPFAQTTGTDTLTDVSTATRRTAKIREIEGLKRETSGGTDYGEALYRAYELLSRRGETDNQPMIILLTDGENKPNGTAKAYWACDPDSGVFTQTTPRAVTTQDADLLVDIMEEQLAEAGIPVYTVALYNARVANSNAGKAEEIKTYTARLMELAGRTGGKFYPVETSGTALDSVDNLKNSFLTAEEYAPLSLQELPLAFGAMFADRIGSSPPQTLYPEAREDGRYAVAIPILNGSVSQANLFMLKTGLKESSIRLTDGEGRAVGVQPFSSDHFVLYKLSGPLQAGLWQLEFELADNAAAAEATDSLAVNLLCSYDALEMRTAVRVNANAAVGADEIITAAKKDTLTVEAYFYDLTRQQRAEDESLYLSGSLDEGRDAIRGAWTLEHITGGGVPETVAEGAMQPGSSSLTAELPLARVALDSEGHSRLKDGAYRLTVSLEGAGISRSRTLSLTLTNTAPTLISSPSVITVDVDHAGVPGSDAPMDFTVDLTGLVADADGDALSFSMADDTIDDALDMRLSGSTLICRTVMDAERMREGTAEAVITVSDGDDGVLELPLTFRVVSGLNAFAACYDMTVACTDASGEPCHEEDRLPKNRPYTFMVTPVAEHAQDAPQVDWQQDVRVELTGLADEPIPLAWNGSGYACAITPEHHLDGRELTFRVSYNGQVVFAPVWTLNVVNIAPGNPQLTDAQKSLTLRHHALPALVSFLEQPTEGEALTVDLSAYLTDEDGDPLTYTLTLQDEAGEALLACEELSGGVFRLTPREGAHGSAVLQLRATDNDGESTGVLRITCQVVDLWRKWVTLAMIAVPALLVLILLLCAIVRLSRPRFPVPYTLHAREGISAFDFASFELPPSRKGMTLAAFIPEEAAREAGISPAALSEVLLTPVRAERGCIGVSCRPRRLGGASVTLAQQPVGKKVTLWAPGQALELRAHASGTDRFIRVILAASGELVASDAGMPDGFSPREVFGP